MGFLLLAWFVSGWLHASESVSSEEMFELARRLENQGYYYSARSYYERLRRDPQLSDKWRDLLDERILNVSKLITKKQSRRLKSMDEFPSFSLSPTKDEMVKRKPETTPLEFPRTKVRKKRWMIAAAVVIGIAYFIIKENSKDKPPIKPDLTVEF